MMSEGEKLLEAFGLLILYGSLIILLMLRVIDGIGATKEKGKNRPRRVSNNRHYGGAVFHQNHQYAKTIYAYYPQKGMIAPLGTFPESFSTIIEL